MLFRSVVANRSGNRGVCAQPCRSAYGLRDATGKTLIDRAHLFSLKDLNLSEYLYDLIQAGITSFKIEGRLKDITYLKNITAFYRRLIDEIIENGECYGKASSGKVNLRFIPNPCKTFNRGYTNYFIEGRKEKVASPQTQKSVGERLGKITQVHSRWFETDTDAIVSPGDGLCYFRAQGLEGMAVNKVEGKRIFPAKSVQLEIGTEIFRNNDFRFEKQLSGDSADRRIAVSFELREHDSGYTLCAVDEDENRTEYSFDTQKLPAKDVETSRKQIDTQLRKLGNTVFTADCVVISESFCYFIPAAELNEMRRQTILLLENLRTSRYRAPDAKVIPSDAIFPENTLDYRGNAANRYAKDFYRRHGVDTVDDAFELQKDYRGKTLMTTKHCIKYQHDQCPLKQHPSNKWKEPLFIADNHSVYRLEFDCRACEMKVIK